VHNANKHKYREFKTLEKCGNIRYRCTCKNCYDSLLVNDSVSIVIIILICLINNNNNHEVIANNIIGRKIIEIIINAKMVY